MPESAAADGLRSVSQVAILENDGKISQEVQQQLDAAAAATAAVATKAAAADAAIASNARQSADAGNRSNCDAGVQTDGVATDYRAVADGVTSRGAAAPSSVGDDGLQAAEWEEGSALDALTGMQQLELIARQEAWREARAQVRYLSVSSTPSLAPVPSPNPRSAALSANLTGAPIRPKTGRPRRHGCPRGAVDARQGEARLRRGESARWEARRGQQSSAAGAGGGGLVASPAAASSSRRRFLSRDYVIFRFSQGWPLCVLPPRPALRCTAPRCLRRRVLRPSPPSLASLRRSRRTAVTGEKVSTSQSRRRLSQGRHPRSAPSRRRERSLRRSG